MIKTTKEIKVSNKTYETIIGQDKALEIIKKAAKQRRNVLLIGDPGTGKSLLGLALAELLPTEKLVDVLSFDNPIDENNPIIKTVPKGEGKEIVSKARLQALTSFKKQSTFIFILVILSMITPWLIRRQYGDIMAAASLIGSMIFLGAFILFLNINRRVKTASKVPKLLIDNSQIKRSPFLDASGAHAGALLGDCLHDPLQSGGLGTPAYERLIPGLIHKANKGVLFVDEIANLKPESQQELLTAIQEKKYPITGQSERSSGAMVRSDPIPTDFILVAAGNLETIKHIHSALRSRIRGYGYEVFMNSEMDDNLENRKKIIQFIAQEVKKDDKIPHFREDAINEIIEEAKRRTGKHGKLTLRLRDLGGLIRAAGDLALEEKSELVTLNHVIRAKELAKTLEHQLADRYIESKRKYEIVIIKGTQIGRVNGLAVMGSDSSYSGIVLPIESEITIGGKKSEIIATGKLGKIAKEAVKNVSAIILKYFGEDIKEKYDIFVQFIQTYEGLEGDSASIAVATAIISALKKVPVRQDTAMTGSLSVRGEVMAVGGVSAKVEAAIDSGIKRVIIPKTNEKDVIIQKEKLRKIEVIPVSKIEEVLEKALDWKGKESILNRIKKFK